MNKEEMITLLEEIRNNRTEEEQVNHILEFMLDFGNNIYLVEISKN